MEVKEVTPMVKNQDATEAEVQLLVAQKVEVVQQIFDLKVILFTPV